MRRRNREIVQFAGERGNAFDVPESGKSSDGLVGSVDIEVVGVDDCINKLP